VFVEQNAGRLPSQDSNKDAPERFVKNPTAPVPPGPPQTGTPLAGNAQAPLNPARGLPGPPSVPNPYPGAQGLAPPRGGDFPRMDPRQAARQIAAPSGGQPDFSERIDSLLASALQEQSREKRFLIETVYGAKSALVKAQEELKGIRDLVAARDREVMGLLESRLPGIQTQHLAARVEAIERSVGEPEPTVLQMLESRLEKRIDVVNERIDAIEEALIQLADRVAQLPRTFRDDLEVSAVALGDRMGEEAMEVIRSVRSISDAVLADLREDAVDMVQTLRLLSETVADDFRSVVETSRKQTARALDQTRKQSLDLMKSVAGGINETTKITAEALAEHLTSYLSQRDERIGNERDQVLINLFKELGESLTRRDRKKVSQALSESYGTQAGGNPGMRAPSPPPSWPPFRSPQSISMVEPKSRIAPGDPRTGLSQSPPGSAARIIAEALEDSGEDLNEYLRVPPPGVPSGSRSGSSPPAEPLGGRGGRRAAATGGEPKDVPAKGRVSRRTAKKGASEEDGDRARKTPSPRNVSATSRAAKPATLRGRSRDPAE
jgi:hypothetical protein